MFTLQFNNFGALWSSSHQLKEIFVIINCFLFYPALSIHPIFKSTRQIFSTLIFSTHIFSTLIFSTDIFSTRIFSTHIFSTLSLLLISNHPAKPYSSSSYFQLLLLISKKFLSNQKMFHDHPLHHSLQQPYEPKLLLKVLDPPIASFHVRYSLKLSFSNTAILCGGRR